VQRKYGKIIGFTLTLTFFTIAQTTVEEETPPL
jgi:hypothetical protein